MFADIVTQAVTRLSAINRSSGYNTDIGDNIKRGASAMPLSDLPYCAAHVASRAAEESAQGGKRQKASAQLIIEAAAEYGDHSFDVAKLLLADIQTAMEIEPQNLGGLLTGNGLEWVSDDIVFPSEGSNVVGVTVIYSIPHLRFYGDPTKPEVN
jgi:hypothetical protein